MKNQKIIFIISLVLAILAVGFACVKLYRNIKNSQQASQNAVATTSARTIEEKSITNKNDFYEITAKYPIDSLDKNNRVTDFINTKIKVKEEEWKVGGQVWSDEQDVSKRFPDRPKMKYTYDISYKTFESKLHNTTSYVFNIYEFTGGAHGNSTVYTFTFNKNGELAIEKILNLSESNNDIALSRVLADALLKSSNDMYSKDMVMNGLGLAFLSGDGKTFDNAKCDCDGFFFGSNFQKFYVTDNGLTFLFDQYEVAPGAAGIPEVNIPWSSLLKYLINPNF